MKKIVLLRSNQISSDSRVEKYLAFYKKEGIDYSIIGWDRKASGANCERTIYYKRNAGYVIGGIKAAFNRLLWFIFVIRTLCRMNTRPTFIHACDLDTAFPAAIYKSLFNKKVYVLFDVFDWTSHTQSDKANKLLLTFIKSMEEYCVKRVDKIIICENERKEQIKNSKVYDISILPNIPMVEDEKSVKVLSDKYKFNNDKITLSYVGWFGKSRFLDELLDLAEDKMFNLLIAGYGNVDLENRCKRLSLMDNVKYFGKVPYMKGLEIMFNSDMIYAMYCKDTKNHYYAAPNKYYEIMLLGKPLITTKGIIIGEKVEKENIGYTIEENKEDFAKLLNNISKVDIKIKGENALRLWNTKYCNYTKDFLNTQYKSLLR